MGILVDTFGRNGTLLVLCCGCNLVSMPASCRQSVMGVAPSSVTLVVH